ncbi:MAG: putative sulfate/molybdate transporter [Methanocellales archaeon]|nr:putative sulfate/molybdate transporter [Methanocellales archaeon]MDD3291687.1 putative sulfate/molybdate transporter [Methanocellales archaeon]MDD5235037.1 putative sulfate/molybdate transporter [Methanocellales archaeon]MDD5485175.1 putative sulfate/molybdate transporter [Methanocellales archaeon]
MVRIKDFEFSLVELAGALGDFGPLNPFIIGYIAVLGLDPSGILIAMGVTNLIVGLIYKLPLPVEPQKAVGVVALNEHWSPSLVYGTGIGMGLIWLFLAFSKSIGKIAKVIPLCVIVGVQFGLALTLLKESLELIWTNIFLAAMALILVMLLIKNKKLPAGLAIFLLGLAVVFISTPDITLEFGLYLPKIYVPSLYDMGRGLLTVGIAQVVLTLSNAVLATSLAVNNKFPGNRIGEENLAKNIGWMNTIFPFFGGIPMCHGAGGFAAQYFFGARTGGAMLMEGILEIILAFFLAESVSTIFGAFPLSIIGVMLFFAALELGKFMRTLGKTYDMIIAVTVGVISLLTNLGIGFFAGLALCVVSTKYLKKSF